MAGGKWQINKFATPVSSKKRGKKEHTIDNYKKEDEMQPF